MKRDAIYSILFDGGTVQQAFQGHRVEICGVCKNRLDCITDEKPNTLFCIAAWDKWRVQSILRG